MPLNIPTEWAQREDKLFLTFKSITCNDGKVEFEKKKIVFTGTNGKDTYETTLELFDEVKTEGNQVNRRGAGYECVVYKENLTWWPRLLANKTKQHWLKVDFKRWKDEDDSEVEEDYADDGAGDAGMGMGGPGQPDLAQMMAQMGGGAPMGMDQMGGLSESDSEVDSDDEDIPGLENDVEPPPAATEVPPTKS